MVYAVSDIARRNAQDLPSAGQPLRGRARKLHASRAAAVSIHWPRVIALGLNVLTWGVVIAGVRWVIHH